MQIVVSQGWVQDKGRNEAKTLNPRVRDEAETLASPAETRRRLVSRPFQDRDRNIVASTSTISQP